MQRARKRKRRGQACFRIVTFCLGSYIMRMHCGLLVGTFLSLAMGMSAQAEMINGTIAVIVIVGLIATFLGIVDFGLSRMMQMVLG